MVFIWNFKFKNRARKRAKLENDQIAYKKLKNKLKFVVCQAKLDDLQTYFVLSKSHPTFAAELWSRINGVLNQSTSPTRADVSISPDVLNDFFRNIAVSSSHQSATSFILPDDDADSAFSFDKISVDTAFKHLCSLGVSKSTGPDGPVCSLFEGDCCWDCCTTYLSVQ